MVEIEAFRNLYRSTACLWDGKKEPQHIVKALRPGCLVVRAAFHFHISQIDAEPPALPRQGLFQQVRVAYMPASLRRSDIQPDAQIGLRAAPIHDMEDAAMIPPDRRRHNSQPPEEVRVRKPQIQRD